MERGRGSEEDISPVGAPESFISAPFPDAAARRWPARTTIDSDDRIHRSVANYPLTPPPQSIFADIFMPNHVFP